MSAGSRVVAAVAHAGRRYPPELLSATRLTLPVLRQFEDAYVDVLAAGVTATGASLLIAEVARAWVDLNRAEDELDPTMFADWAEGGVTLQSRPSARVQAGLGTLPRVGPDGRDIYRRKLSQADAQERLASVYRPYHETLASLVRQAREAHGEVVLLDLHSMPSRLHGKPAGVDAVIGNRQGTSAAEWVTARVEDTLTAHGLKVVRNTPYAGGHVTGLHGEPHRQRHAIQIELNRALYMDEPSLTLRRDHGRVAAAIQAVAAALA